LGFRDGKKQGQGCWEVIGKHRTAKERIRAQENPIRETNHGQKPARVNGFV